MTCVGCGLALPEDVAITERGAMHRICAAIARMQAHRGGPDCYKHGEPLDETGWCPSCRQRVIDAAA